MKRSKTRVPTSKDASVFHGENEHGKPITLLATGKAGTKGWGAMEEMSYSSLCALIGIHVRNKQSFSAKKLIIEVQQLFGWLGRSGFFDSSGREQNELRISYRLPDNVSLEIAPGIQMTLATQYSYQDKWQERFIGEDAQVSFSAKRGFSLERCFDLLASVRLLLHFASMRRVEPVHVRCHVRRRGFSFEGRWIPDEIEIWNANRGEARSESPFSDLWIFRFADIENRAQAFFATWFKCFDDFREAMDCYSATVYHSLPSSIEHLSLTQALEAYHGLKFKSSANVNFHERLHQLVLTHQSALGGLITNAKAFVDSVQATRNYYTHHNQKWLTKGAVTDFAGIVRLNEKLTVLFQICILSNLGIPADRFPRLRRQLASRITTL